MTARQPLVLVMAGGTGGHVYPALAVALELIARGYRVQWVGTERGLEHRVVPDAGITLHCLPVRGVRGKSLLNKLLGVCFLLLASLQALWLVYRLAPRCVVGMGGYVAGPAGVAAWLLRKPLLIHEQNAVAGTTNRMLAPLADKIVAGFDGAFAQNIVYTVLGNPVRAELLQASLDGRYDFTGQRALRLLVLGGSLGAQPINSVVPSVLHKLVKAGRGDLEIWHQAGEAHVEGVAQSYGERLDSGVRVAPFIEDMAKAYGWADLVLCRAGALTVSELAIMGRPSILVPLPHAIDDHQSANARFLADCGGAVLLPQSEMTVDKLSSELSALLDQPDRLAAMASAALGAAMPEAAAAVSDCCEELMNG